MVYQASLFKGTAEFRENADEAEGARVSSTQARRRRSGNSQQNRDS